MQVRSKSRQLCLDNFEIFEDAGYSTKNTERPAQRMMRLRSGEFSHLVVWKIDRISRNLIDFATMYEAKSGGAPGMI
ncbi:MAG: recombinase family protein [Clostridiales bacterium]|nr:recombinase family protein [Clostridiales bacterium]